MIKKLRKAFRQSFGQAMTRLNRAEAPNPPLEAASLRRIVIVRSNGRMGNTLFLTPLLTDLAQALPNATIDVVSLYPEAGELLKGLPGLRRVMILPHKDWWRLHRTLSTLRQVRSEYYDLAIDPSPESLGGRLAMMFCRARWRLGFRGANQWLSLSHSVDIPTGSRHEAVRSLALLERLPHGPLPPARLHLALDADERRRGAERFKACLDAQAPDRRSDQPVVGYFAHARGSKSLGLDWWQKFWRRLLSLEPDIIALEVLPSPTTARVMDGSASIHVPAARDLVATVAGLDLFISADTGPMHLASSTDVPVIALFGPTDPAKFGPLKPDDAVIRLEGLSAEDAAEACWPILRSRLAKAKAV
jgi:heptosyltransferase-3